MAFVPVTNGIALCFDFTAAGQLWQFCLVIRAANNPPTESERNNAVNSGYNAWSTDLKSVLGAGVTLRQIRGTDISVQGGPASIRTVNEAATGLGTALPLNAACCVSLRTAKRGRSYRGRAYLSGLTTSDISSANIFDPTFLTNLLGFFTELVVQLTANSLVLVVASKQHNKIVTSPAETNVVTSITIDTFVDSQRRRLTGRGD